MADRSRPRGALTPLLAALLLAPLLLLLPAVGGQPARAVQPAERLADPQLEARARGLSRELRCVVCQNQSIDDSDAELAQDLRLLVRERLRAGDSDRQVLDYVVSRYGDFVLLKPPLKPATWALWFGPAVVLVLGAIALVVFVRRRARAAPAAAPLSPAEEERLARLLQRHTAPPPAEERRR